MDLPRLEALSTYWSSHPPVHLSMAAYVGWGKSKASAGDTGDVDQLMNSMPVKEFTPDGR